VVFSLRPRHRQHESNTDSDLKLSAKTVQLADDRAFSLGAGNGHSKQTIYPLRTP
jgi:hypothetical protein